MASLADGAHGSLSRKRKAIAEESSSDLEEVEFCSSSKDDDDIVAELSSSSELGDDDDNDSDGGGDFDSSRQWCRVDAKNPPPCPPRFQFLQSPRKTFHVEDLEDPLQYFKVLLDDQLIDLMATETNRYAAQFLSSKRLKPHSRFGSWVPVTTGEMSVSVGLAASRNNSEARTKHVLESAQPGEHACIWRHNDPQPFFSHHEDAAFCEQ